MPLRVRERRGGRRDPYFDNAKFLAILLVVAGHALGPLEDARFVGAEHLFVWTFHMPVFIVIAGYFSRTFPSSPEKVRRLIGALAVPYLVFDVVYSLVGHWIGGYWGGDKFVLSPLSPYFVTWFLLALLVWRLSTPVWQQLRWPLPVAVGISMMAGALEVTPDRSFGRILGLLPFFVLGLTLNERHFAVVRRPLVRAAAVPVLAAGAAVAYLAEPHMSEEWMTWRHSYENLGVSVAVGMGMRLGLLVCGVTLTAAFLALVPARRTWFTELGSRSLYPYLLHGLLYMVAGPIGVYAWLSGLDTLAAAMIIVVASGVVTVILSTDALRRALRWLVEPPLDVVFRPRGRLRPE
ncbi:MAG: acyltransferase family protein [Streptosporangiales bacterium]|nr:acyltransferase family protein [Streptosporangiales bacterium]